MIKLLSVKETEKGKSLVNLLTESKFLVKFGTTSTSFNLRIGVGEQEPMCVMGREEQ